MKKKYLTPFIYPIIVLLLHIIISLFNVYNKIIWIDNIMHLLGGISIGITYSLLIKRSEEENYLRIEHKFIQYMIIISLVALTAVIWEFYEFIMDQLIETLSQPSLKDTMGDLFLGLLGGTLSYLGMHKRK